MIPHEPFFDYEFINFHIDETARGNSYPIWQSEVKNKLLIYLLNNIILINRP